MRESNDTPKATAPGGRGPRWVRILLVASLALNLIGAGLMAGAWLGHDPKTAPARRDFALGPLAAAMTHEDWKAMRPAFLALHPDLGRGPEALEQEYLPLLAALRAEPVDAGAITAALATLSEQNASRLASAREVIGGYLTSLPAEARAQYLARLEAFLAEAHERHARKRN